MRKTLTGRSLMFSARLLCYAFGHSFGRSFVHAFGRALICFIIILARPIYANKDVDLKEASTPKQTLGKPRSELLPEEPLPGEVNGLQEEISTKFSRGIHLIYYCEDQHWACVDSNSYVLCKKWREEAINKEELKLRCIPVGNFKSEKECIDAQKKAINYPQKVKNINGEKNSIPASCIKAVNVESHRLL